MKPYSNTLLSNNNATTVAFLPVACLEAEQVSLPAQLSPGLEL
ncbi:MAG: hypothetical protein ACJAWL_000864 [Motiliproteus sp.]|jgi:hypothetical protein